MGVRVCLAASALSLVACESNDGGRAPAGDAGVNGGAGGTLGGGGAAAGNGSGAATGNGGAGGPLTSSVPTVSSCSEDGWCWVNPLPTGEDLRAVHGSAPNDVWVTGGTGLVLHWNGAEWGRVAGPTPGISLTGVWAFAPDDVWAVGGSYADGEKVTLFHFNGSAWTSFPADGVGSPAGFWGFAPDDLWLHGADRDGLLHWNGTAWTASKAPVPPHDSSDTIRVESMWGSAANDVWLVGVNATKRSWTVSHWDGAAWKPSSLPSDIQRPFRIFGRSATEVSLVASAAPEGYAAIYSWDGSAWVRLADSPAVSATLPSLLPSYASLGGGNGHVWLFSSYPARDAILPLAYRDSSGWESEAVAAEDPENIGHYASVWSAASGEAWAVGGKGLIAHRAGGKWSSFSRGNNQATLTSGWGTTPASFVLGADPNLVLRWAGGKLATAFQFASRSEKDIAVTGSSDTDIWAGFYGSGDNLTHFDGQIWSDAFSLGSVTLSSTGQHGHHHAIEGWLFTTRQTNGCVTPTCNYGSGHMRTDGITVEDFPSTIVGARGTGAGIFAVNPGDVWFIVNNQPTPLLHESLIVHVVNGAGKTEKLPVPPGVTEPFYSVLVGSGPKDIWALGSQCAAHYDGQQWTPSNTDFTPERAVIGKSGLWTLSGSRPGEVRHLVNGSWVRTNTFQRELRGLWMADDGTVFVAGTSGTILRHGEGAGGAPGTGGAGGFDAEKAVLCDRYCREFLSACRTLPSNTYADMPSCKSTCAAFARGTIEDDSLECRQHQVELILAGQSPEDFCPRAAERSTVCPR